MLLRTAAPWIGGCLVKLWQTQKPLDKQKLSTDLFEEVC